VYFLKQNHKVLGKLKEIKSIAKNQWSQSIKIISDNGGEYVNHGFEEVSLKIGITCHYTIYYNPRWNCVVETKNQILIEMARCMLHIKRTGYKFCVEAMACALYILN